MSKLITDKDIVICGHGYGNPSTKNLYDYSLQRYKQIASNGVHKGIVAVKRHINMSPELRIKFHNNYKTLLGRNIYDQNRRSYVYRPASDGKYYSDCSSSGMATMRDKCGLKIGSWLLNTAAIFESPMFETVPVIIVNGHIMNPEVLEVGDCILFAGSDPSRPRQIGHVEYVYEMPGDICPLRHESTLYERKDILSKKITKVPALEQIRVVKDCGDGWSIVIFNYVEGYMKNTGIVNKKKSYYPISKVEKACWLRKKNNRLSEKLFYIPNGTKVKVITKRKYWSRVIILDDDDMAYSIEPMKGWIKTKYLT